MDNPGDFYCMDCWEAYFFKGDASAGNSLRESNRKKKKKKKKKHRHSSKSKLTSEEDVSLTGLESLSAAADNEIIDALGTTL